MTLLTRFAARRAAAVLLVCALPGIGGSRVHAQDEDRKPCADAAVASQIVDPADEWAVRLRLAQLQQQEGLTGRAGGAMTIRRPSSERGLACREDTDHFSATLLPLRARLIYNTAYPVDVNNGALWGGVGANVGVSAGGEIRYGGLRAGVYPLLATHGNSAYPMNLVEHPEYSSWRYRGHVIDWTQRFGEDRLTIADIGQSYVRFDAFGAAIGLSNENMWLGPAQRMPLLMGSSAAGFPHLFIGSSRPVDIRIGSVELQAFWGRLSESDYFDFDPANDHHLIAGLSVVFEPAFARGLFIGANRMYLAGWEGGSIGSYLLDPYTGVRDNPRGDNQLFSLYGRWLLPSAGFEVYAEWAREDHWGDWMDLLREPDHSQFYVLGFQKTGRLGGRGLRWFGELAHLTAAAPFRSGRGFQVAYTHTELRQGFTHRGQLLGAWIGPGSDAQVLGVETRTPYSTTGLTIERVRYDADAYWDWWGHLYGMTGHDVSLGAMLRHAEGFGALHVQGGIGVARRHNRQGVFFTGSHPPVLRSETNVYVDLEARWRPNVRLRR
jgi:hypothetical protein